MTDTASPTNHAPALRRELGVFGASMMGLGSIVGTGVFVSLGIAASITGPSVMLAIVIAAGLAVCNALSSAQLAASHPVSGGTYEYGYRFLNPALGFIAGWMFLCAKSASAATAALGFAGYLLRTIDRSDSRWQIAIALAAVVMLTLVVLAGVRRSNRVNIVIVGLTFASLIAFVIAGLAPAISNTPDSFNPFFNDESNSLAALLHASALMFVAYTGYGRIATLGEEVRDPRRNIPIAIIATLIASTALYVAVAFVAVATIGAAALGEAAAATAAPLEVAAESFGTRLLAQGVAVGAMTAMLGVLLNLILGLSRVLLAMGRRGDMPAATSRLNAQQTTPTVAVVVVGVMIASIVAIGSVKVAWSFSAFTVLIYYAITNLAAMRMPMSERRFHPAFAWLGLAGCLGLAFWVDVRVWGIGLALIAAGLLWRLGMRASAARQGDGARNRADG